MNDLTAPISAVFEVHPALLDGVCRLLDQRKDWDGDRVVNAAIALYLLQAGDADPDIVCRLLDQRKDWDGDRVVNAAIALYLLQAGDADPDIRRVYLGQTFAVEEP